MTLLGIYVTATDISIIMLVLNTILFILLLRIYIRLRRQE